MESAGVERAVLVQHLGEDDNAYLGRIVSNAPRSFAAACLVNPDDPTAATTLHGLAAEGFFRGVRFPLQVLRAAPQLWDAAAELGMVIVAFAAEGLAGQAAPLRRFLA